MGENSVSGNLIRPGLDVCIYSHGLGHAMSGGNDPGTPEGETRMMPGVHTALTAWKSWPLVKEMELW